MTVSAERFEDIVERCRIRLYQVNDASRRTKEATRSAGRWLAEIQKRIPQENWLSWLRGEGISERHAYILLEAGKLEEKSVTPAPRREWRKLYLVRLIVQQRALCGICGNRLPIDEHQIHIDHKVPISRGGMDWPENLQATCAPCNLRKGSREIVTNDR